MCKKAKVRVIGEGQATWRLKEAPLGDSRQSVVRTISKKLMLTQSTPSIILVPGPKAFCSGKLSVRFEEDTILPASRVEHVTLVNTLTQCVLRKQM
jgi:hypothetical protein